MKFEMTVTEVKRYDNTFVITCMSKTENCLAFRFISDLGVDLSAKEYLQLPLRVGDKIAIDVEKVMP